jgi:hypothetical protein
LAQPAWSPPNISRLVLKRGETNRSDRRIAGVATIGPSARGEAGQSPHLDEILMPIHRISIPI